MKRSRNYSNRLGLSSRPYKKRAYQKKTATPRQNLIRLVKRVTNRTRELKYVDTDQSHNVQPSTPTADDLTLPGQGVTDQSRVGDSIEWRDVELRFTFRPASVVTTGPTNYQGRVVLVQWHEDTASNPCTWLNVFQTLDPRSPYSHDAERAHQFTILADYFVGVGGSEVWQTVINRECHVWHTKGRQEVNFFSGGGDGNHHIFLLAITDNSGPDSPVLDYYARVNYYDP